MNRSRPVNLNLFKFHFPIPAIVSILHRVTGVFLFLLIPFALWLLAYSFTAPGFEYLQNMLTNQYIKLFLWVMFVPFCFHFVAGIRHLLSDVHLGDTLQGGRLSAWLTFVFSAILVILVGIWLW